MGPSSLTALDKALSGVHRLAIDTAPIIYFIEENPKYLPLVDVVFEKINTGSLTAITSAITLTEVLTHPLRLGNDELRKTYSELLLGSRNFATLPIEISMADTAAELRARHGLRTPDALQLACGIAAGCDAFLTNDQALRRVTEISVLVLDELLEDAAHNGG